MLSQHVSELAEGGQRRAELVRNRRHEVRLQARCREFPAGRAKYQVAGNNDQHRQNEKTRHEELAA